MGHEWKVGDWAELYDGTRYLIIKALSQGDCQFVNAYSGSGAVRTFSIGASNLKHLPDCTGWDWEPPKPVEPTARKWEFGDWAHSPLGIIRFIAYHGDMWFLCADGLIRPLEGRNAIYLPDCTGFDWTPPSPVKQIEPPTGYRLLGRDEVVADGDLFIKRAPAGNDYDWRTASGDSCCTVGYFVDSFEIVCFARKIEPRYRPFANAAEFAPHRDRWVRLKSDTSMQMRVVCYNDRVVWIESDRVTGNRYGYVFDRFVFEDGTPFGVLDTKE